MLLIVHPLHCLTLVEGSIRTMVPLTKDLVDAESEEEEEKI